MPGRVVDSDSEESKDSTYSPSSTNEGKYTSSTKSSSRTNFTNALLRVGTKSTKDSSLDKPVRKGAGLLLEAAGRSLLQKAGGGSTQSYKLGSGGSSMLSSGATIGGLSFGLASSKISFGLYGGHLPVDHGSYTKPKSGETSPTGNESTEAAEADGGGRSKASDSMTRQKVFSNWGGEFFKKNLDYRANTNKILEKMNLGGTKSNGDNQASSSSGFRSMAKAESSKRTASDSASSPAKKLKTSFLNSYS